MITDVDFLSAVHLLSEVLPFAKPMGDETRAVLWRLWPEQAKRDLTPADLEYAITQRLMDPDPPREMPVSTVLLHYLYPRRDGALVFDRGPRRRAAVPAAEAGQYREERMAPERRVFRAGPDGVARPVDELLEDALGNTLRKACRLEGGRGR